MNANNSTELSNVRSSFYRNNYSRLLNLLRLMVFINLGLLIALVYLLTRPTVTPYFAAKATGGMVQLYAFDQPIVSAAALLDWANQAAVAVYNYTFIDVDKQLRVASEYFTPQGWKFFNNSIQEVVATVKDKKLIVTAVVTGAPVITKQGPLLGHYSWNIRMPLLVTYESASEKQQQLLMVNMVVTRVPPETNIKGIAIAQFYTEARSLSGNR